MIAYISIPLFELAEENQYISTLSEIFTQKVQYLIGMSLVKYILRLKIICLSKNGENFSFRDGGWGFDLLM